jgi:hypothetical protein
MPARRGQFNGSNITYSRNATTAIAVTASKIISERVYSMTFKQPGNGTFLRTGQLFQPSPNGCRTTGSQSEKSRAEIEVVGYEE